MKFQLLFLVILIFSFDNFSIASHVGRTTLQEMLERSKQEVEKIEKQKKMKEKHSPTIHELLERSKQEEMDRLRKKQLPSKLKEMLERSKQEKIKKKSYYSNFFQGESYGMNITQILAPLQQVDQCGKNSFIYSRTMAEGYEDLLQHNRFEMFHNVVSGKEVQSKIKELIGGQTCQIDRNVLKNLNGGKDSNPVEKTGIYLTIWDEDNLYERNVKTGEVEFGFLYEAFFSPNLIQPAKKRIMKGNPEVFVIKQFKTAHWIAAIILKKKKTRSKKEEFEVVFIDPIASENNKIKNYRYLFERMIDLLT